MFALVTWGLALILGLDFGPVALAAGAAIALQAVVFSFLLAGARTAAATVPLRLTVRGVSAVLMESRNFGLAVGLAVGLVYTLVFGLIQWFYDLSANGQSAHGPAGLVHGLVHGLPFGLGLGLIFALSSGLDYWLYYHWLRRRLASQGLLPLHLREFLDWCVSSERGWLRVSDAYEFRHREFFDYLALTRQAGV